MIDLEHVSKFILSDVSIHIPQGEAVCLVGESGAGKTTFIKLCCGLLVPEKGRVRTMLLEPEANRNKYGRKISTFMAGVPYLSSEDSVRTGFELLREVYEIPRMEFEKEYACLAEALNYGDYEHQAVKKLSLGQRMRVELAASMIYRPDLLMLDEPTIGLDEIAKAVLGELLRERVKEGMTLVMASHDMEEVSSIGSRFCLLQQGKIAFYGDEEALRMQYEPMDMIRMRVLGKLPDLGDLPLKMHTIDNDMLTLIFPANHIRAVEVLRLILEQTTITEVTIRKTALSDVILQNR